MEDYSLVSMDHSKLFFRPFLDFVFFCRYFPAQSGKIISILILIIALLFNLPQFFELKTVVLDSVNNTRTVIARPTKLRLVRLRNAMSWPCLSCY